MTTDSESVRSRARDLFSEWLDRHEAGSAEPFDELRHEHPDLASRLERLHAAWLEMETALAATEDDVEPASSLELAEGEDRYSFLRPLARGGMGQVDVFRDLQLGREVARKTLLEASSDASTRRRQDRFVNEARITAQLAHPGIVPVHDLGVGPDGKPSFTMTLVEGESLADGLQSLRNGERGWTRERALGVLIRICEAVAFAHSRGVVHRDLKPSNVLVGRFGEVYVVDWGLAGHGASDSEIANSDEVEPAERGWQTLDGEVLGTPSYMSPEQASGDHARVGPTADVYAIGAMLYEILSGEPPFGAISSATSADRTLRSLRSGAPRAVDSDSAPPALLAIQERSMARDPADRYPSADELRADLVAFTEQRVVRAHRTGAWPEICAWVRRHRALSAVVLVAVLGLSITLLLVERERRRAENALVTVREERTRADEEASAATTGFSVAAESMDRMLTEVGLRLLEDVPGAMPLRQELVGDALDLAERLKSLRPDDPEVQRRLIRARNHAAFLLVESGDSERALGIYRDAVADLRQLMQEPAPLEAPQGQPWRAILWCDLLANVTGLAERLANQGDAESALEVLGAVEEGLSQQLAESRIPALLRWAASRQAQRAFAFSRLGRHEDSLVAARAALVLQREAHEAAADDAELAYSMMRVARSELRVKRAEAASTTLAEATTILDRLLASADTSTPRVRGYAQDAMRLRASILFEQGRGTEALEALQLSAAMSADLAEDFPQTSRHRIEEALARGRIGEELWKKGSGEQAVASLEAGLEAVREFLTLSPEASLGPKVFGQIQKVRFRTALRRQEWRAAAALVQERVDRLTASAERRTAALQWAYLAKSSSVDPAAPSGYSDRCGDRMFEILAAETEDLDETAWSAEIRTWLSHDLFGRFRDDERFPKAPR